MSFPATAAAGTQALNSTLLGEGMLIRFLCCGHFACRNGLADGEAQYPEIERKYTPVSGNELKGYVDLVVKVYRRGEQTQFPDGGKMSQYLDNLKIGDAVDVVGPCG